MGSIKLPHSSGNSMSIAAPATNPASDLEIKLPATIGSAGQILKNSSTAGTLEFATGGKLLNYVQTWDYTHVTLADNGDNYSQLNTNITPTSTASRVLVMISLGLVSSDSAADVGWSLQRDSTWLGVPSSTSATNEATFGAFMNHGSGEAFPSTMHYLDHPNTTSQVTYKVISRANSPRDMVINRRNQDNALRVSSFMQLLEFA